MKVAEGFLHSITATREEAGHVQPSVPQLARHLLALYCEWTNHSAGSQQKNYQDRGV